VAEAAPAAVPPKAAEAARDNLGGAVSAADTLPDRLGAGLLDVAREAFTQGLHLTATTSAALALGMSVLVLVLLRDARPNSQIAEAGEADAAVERSG
jgi:DHA2 family multidrug resistance protein-like MFS transporter